MINDRDLAVLGAGAILAIVCLLLPLPFVVKAVLGLFVLVSFMALALLRLGPDRVPVEEWLRRRIRYQMSARRYTYQQPNRQKAAPARPVPPISPAPAQVAGEEAMPKPPVPLPGLQPLEALSRGAISLGTRPVELALDEIGVYPLATVFLAVVGIYFVVWFVQGGGQEIAWMLEHFGGG